MLRINILQNLTAKNKKILLIGLVALLLAAIIFAPKAPTPTQTNDSVTNFTVSEETKDERPFQAQNYNSGFIYSKTEGEKQKEKLRPKLPYSIDFNTSIGKTTTINIYTIFSDPRDTIHVEIYGINYHNTEVDETLNPDVIAFKESFIKIKEVLAEMGVNLKDMNVYYGSNDYMHNTSEFWIKFFRLLE